MKYVSEYRNPKLVEKLVYQLEERTTKDWTIMEVCGGQTHSIMKFGLHELLPKKIELLHGPGCPVCVTPISLIDHALHIASQKETILCSFGDMLRVPGSHTNLLTSKARGADVRIVLSPLEAVHLAEQNPHKQVVFFGIGFETTAPANAMAVALAKKRGLTNFSLLSSHVLVLPALRFLLESPTNEIQGFLAAGHVCTVTGYEEYHALATQYRIPIVITGFEPVDILQGILACIEQLEKGTYSIENKYRRSAQEQGNILAKQTVESVYTVISREWRGIGIIPASGLELKEEYALYDASIRFPFEPSKQAKEMGCISGSVLQGKKKPCDCPLFAKECTPEAPKGAPMVSSEGACAAYYNYSSRKI